MKKGGKQSQNGKQKDGSILSQFASKDIDLAWTTPQWERIHIPNKKNKTAPYQSKLKISSWANKSP